MGNTVTAGGIKTGGSIEYASHGPRPCGTTEYVNSQMLHDDTLLSRLKFVHNVQEFEAQNLTSSRRRTMEEIEQGGLSIILTETITIPVFFHILFKGPRENVGDEDLHKTIEGLNTDFGNRKGELKYGNGPGKVPLNWDLELKIGNMNMQFTWNETDIVRKQFGGDGISVSTWREPHKFKKLGGSDVHRPLEYLNIWVTKIDDPIVGGYSTYPGMDRNVDGITVQPHIIDPTQLPISVTIDRDLSHEVGHWLGLFHTFDPLEDVLDTSHQDEPRCKRIFTRGQVELARSVFTYDPINSWSDEIGVGISKDGSPGRTQQHNVFDFLNGWRWQMVASQRALKPVDPNQKHDIFETGDRSKRVEYDKDVSDTDWRSGLPDLYKERLDQLDPFFQQLFEEFCNSNPDNELCIF
eukprot:123809_1